MDAGSATGDLVWANQSSLAGLLSRLSPDPQVPLTRSKEQSIESQLITPRSSQLIDTRPRASDANALLDLQASRL